MELGWMLLLAVVAALAALLIVLWRPLYKAVTLKRADDHESESFLYKGPGNASSVRFPSIFSPPSVTLSVVIPAYNEVKRIPAMLTPMLAVLRAMAAEDSTFTWEIIVVDDGSKKDNTADFVYEQYGAKLGDGVFRVLKLHVNNGKGGAVRKGAVRARGAYILMADADGATDAKEVRAVMNLMRTQCEKDGLGLVIGSRAHLEDADGAGGKAKRSPLRRLLMWGFHTFIGIMLGGSGHIRDTQCGFKLFTRGAARLLFPVQHIDRWAFDVELLFLAAQHRIPMLEVPVTWNEIDGSNLNVLTSTLEMMRDITAIRACYTLGIWSATPPSPPPTEDASSVDGSASGASAVPSAEASDAGARSTGSRSSPRKRAHA